MFLMNRERLGVGYLSQTQYICLFKGHYDTKIYIKKSFVAGLVSKYFFYSIYPIHYRVPVIRGGGILPCKGMVLRQQCQRAGRLACSLPAIRSKTERSYRPSPYKKKDRH